jgi:hypothetical protein
MKKSDLRRIINSKNIGFDPDRMKAVHIANGLFMEIMGGFYSTDLINRLVVTQKKNQKDPSFKRHDTNYLLAELSEKLPLKTSIEQLNRLRYHLNQHLDADDGVYDHDDSSGCAYSASTSLLITRDRENDGFSGNFIGTMLNHDFGKGPSPLIGKIQLALQEAQDPISSIALIITPENEKVISEVKTYASQNQEYFHEIINRHPKLAELREGLDHIGDYYPGNLSSQRFLRLVTILAGITLIRYFMILFEDYGHKPMHNNNLALLIDAQQISSTRVRLSSQSSYSRFVNSLPELYALWLANWLKDETKLDSQENISRNQIVDTYERILKESKGNDKKLIFPNNIEIPPELRDSNLNVDQALLIAGEHMATNMLRRRSEDDFLSGFVRDVGMRCGLIKPRSSRQQRKHIDPQADTLEVLIIACLDPIKDRKGVRVENFAEQLWKKYGILFGGIEYGSKDFQILSELGIEYANPDDLKANCDTFIKRLTALGLARTYADGYSIVQCP